MLTFHRSIPCHRCPLHDVFAISTFFSAFLFRFTWFQWEMAMAHRPGGRTCSFFRPSCLEFTLRRGVCQELLKSHINMLTPTLLSLMIALHIEASWACTCRPTLQFDAVGMPLFHPRLLLTCRYSSPAVPVQSPNMHGGQMSTLKATT